MGAEAAVKVLHRKRLNAAADDTQRAALEAELVREQREQGGQVTQSVELGVVDRVIDQAVTRRELAGAGHRPGP